MAPTKSSAELEAEEAIRHMGTNALPALLQRMHAQDATLWIRAEVIFKACKSHPGLTRFNRRTAGLVRLSVLTKLLFCLLVYAYGDALELLCDGQAHVSLLRLARILGECACLLVAAVLELSPEELRRHRLAHHLFYEPRKDRKNFYERLAEVTAS